MNPEILRTDSLACPGIAEISFAVKPGDWLRLAGGPQDAGRALVDDIFGLGPLLSPAVFWEGNAVSTLNQSERLRLPMKAAYAHPEGAFLLNLRIWENLLLPLRHHRIHFDTEAIEAEILAAFQSAAISGTEAARILQGRTDDLSDPEIAVCILIRAHLMRPALIVGERLFGGLNSEGIESLSSLLTWMHSQNPALALLTIGDSPATLARIKLSPWPEPTTLNWKETSWHNS